MILKNNGSLHNSDKCISDMNVRSIVIKTEFNHIGSFAKTNLFKFQFMSFYGVELYILDSNYIQKLFTAWRACARKVLNVNSRTRCILIPSLINCKKNPQIIIEERIINFYIKLINHDNYSKFLSNQ